MLIIFSEIFSLAASDEILGFASDEIVLTHDEIKSVHPPAVEVDLVEANAILLTF